MSPDPSLPPPTPVTATQTFAPPALPAAVPLPSGAPSALLPTLPAAAPAHAPQPGPTADPATAPGFVAAVAPTRPVFESSEPLDEPEPIVDEVPARPLFKTRWLRIALIATQLMSLPVGLAASLSPIFAAFAILLAAAAVLALVTWTGLATANVGRARPATRHHRPPRVAFAVLSWSLAPIVFFVGLALVYRVDQWVDAASYDDKGSRSMMFIGVVLVFALVALVAWYSPYGLLGKASKWVNGDHDKFRRWFVAPFAAAVVAAVALILMGLFLNAQDSAGTSDASQTVFAGAGVAVVALPWIAWLICASRAMIDLEEATAHQHRRRSGVNDEVVAMNPLMAAQMGHGNSAAFTASHSASN